MSSIMYNGTKIEELGMRVGQGIVHSSAQDETQQIIVPGRDGELLVSNDRLQSVPAEFPVNLINKNGNLAQIMPRVTDWLSAKGYHDLEWSDDPGFIYRASYVEVFSITETFKNFGQSKLNFLCHPIKFYKDGRTAKPHSKGLGLQGKGNVIAKPIITIKGKGTCTLTINGRKTKVKDIQGSVTLDMQAQQVYSENLAVWDKLVRGPEYVKPYLDYDRPNIINWDGDFTVEIAPYWGVKI